MRARTGFVAGFIAVCAVTVSAQQLMPPAPNEPAIKLQVKSFETLLRVVVLNGGMEIAKKARAIAPGIELQYVSDVEITGWWTPDSGYTFDVTIPEILPTSVLVFMGIQKQQPLSRGTQVAAAAGETRVSPTGTVTNDDRMKESPVVPFDPIAEYSNISRQALIDAMVDNSGGLQFRPGERLQVVAGPGPQFLMPNPLQPESRKLILTVKGEDLLAFRKGDLKREDLIAKIQERRF